MVHGASVGLHVVPARWDGVWKQGPERERRQRPAHGGIVAESVGGRGGDGA